ncbi:MAG: NAD(P)/FAD-dependent oxidoreductase, partial [Lachnospiraceae bacterium]|nr:NAD(P)/FAD-dependent oxidoreductase [Lachnospiraceae bacterium]
CPDMSCRKIAEFISEVTVIRGNADASTALSGLMQKSVGEVILKTCCDDLYRRKTGSLTSKEIENVSELIKGYKVEVAGKGDFRNAQICRGGFSGLNGETLESAVCNGLYFCGEIVDVDGRCGGYNLHWAWASGRAAGASAASSLKKTPEQ